MNTIEFKDIKHFSIVGVMESLELLNMKNLTKLQLSLRTQDTLKLYKWVQ